MLDDLPLSDSSKLIVETVRAASSVSATAQRGNGNESIVRKLRESFDPLVRRLSLDVEPATEFRLR